MQTVEIELQKITLEAPHSRSGESLLSLEMALPRPGVARKTALKSIALRKGKANLARAPFHLRGLLKEKVTGRFGLHLQLTAPQTNPELSSFLRTLAASSVDGLGSLLGLGVEPLALRKLIETPFEEWADQLEDDQARFAVEGSLDLDSETLASGSISVPLKLTHRIRQSQLPPGPQARDQRRKKVTTYKKGLTIGEAVLRFAQS